MPAQFADSQYRSVRSLGRAMVNAALLLTVLSVSADLLANDRPPPQDQPTQVSLGLYLLDVLDIDDSEQMITIDFGLSASWVDPRVKDKAGQTVPLGTIWSPNLQMVAEKNLRLTRPNVLHITEGGHVQYLQRYVGEIRHSSDLSDFPFDSQTFAIQLITPGHSPKEIDLVEDASRTGQAKTWSLVGWNYFEGKWIKDPFFFKPANQQFAGAAYQFTADRKVGFYFWKVLIPLSLVVLMSGAVFWIHTSNPASQISVGYTAILTLVAYRFVIGHMVPEISYLTRLDIFILGASILVFLVLGEAIWTGRLSANGKVAMATRVDQWCRWLFVSAFVAIALIAFVF